MGLFNKINENTEKKLKKIEDDKIEKHNIKDVFNLEYTDEEIKELNKEDVYKIKRNDVGLTSRSRVVNYDWRNYMHLSQVATLIRISTRQNELLQRQNDKIIKQNERIIDLLSQKL